MQTRVKWLLKDLIKYQVIADDIGLDARMFAIRSAKHVNTCFDFISCKISLFEFKKTNF